MSAETNKTYAVGAFVPEKDQEKARRTGSETLRRSDREACESAALDRDYVSFSLFGNDPIYGEFAVINAERIAREYPGWRMVVYHDDSVPASVLDRLTGAGALLIDVQDRPIAHWPGIFWRFDAVTLPGARRVLFRDADSLILPRESDLVKEWVQSGKPFHVIRDWYSHTSLVLAGLWGGYAPYLQDLPKAADDFVTAGKTGKAGAYWSSDQRFLGLWAWPRIKDFALIHDSIHTDLDGVTPFPPAVSDEKGTGALGAFTMRRIDVAFASLKDTQTQDYVLRITDKAGDEICSYPRRLIRGQDSFGLPTHYARAVEGLLWQMCAVIDGEEKRIPLGGQGYGLRVSTAPPP
jgi:hypothetical protein